VGTNSKPFITDAFNGNLYTMEDQAYQEDGGLLPYEVTSALLLKEGDGFSIDLIQIDLETGEGNPLPPGDDPHAILSVSKDNGKTWCMERYVTLGKMGHYKARAQETQLGWARTWAFKLRITDPVPRRVTGVYLTLSPGDA
jgi:hypothetical protein